MVSSERLIEIVKNYPALYDAVHPEYGDEILKSKIWAKIGQAFHTDGYTVEEVWTNLKTSYLRHMKGTDKSKVQLSRGYSYLHWVKTMEFFKPFLQFAASLEANVPSPSDLKPLLGNSDSSDISTTFSEELLQKPKVRKKKGPKGDTSLKSIPNKPEENKLTPQGNDNKEEPKKNDAVADVSVSTSKTHTGETKKNVNVDDNFSTQTITLDNPFKRYQIDSGGSRNVILDAMELIFLGYAKTVKSFTPIRQTYTKMKIAQIIMEQEIQHLDENRKSSVIGQPGQGDKKEVCKWKSESAASHKRGKEKKLKRCNEIVHLM